MISAARRIGMSRRRPQREFDGARFALLALLLASVASMFPARGMAFEKIQAANGKVGVVSILTSEVTNAGGGITVFSRYNHRLSNDWHLDKFCVEKTKSLLEAAGYRAVDLSVDDASLAAIASADDLSRMNRDGLTRDWKAKYQEILSKNGLVALVVLRDNSVWAPNAKDENVAHGFVVTVSSGFNNIKQFLTTVTADAIGGTPPHRAVLTCLAREKFDPGIIPVKLKDATISDLAPLRPRFEKLLEDKIRFDLSSAGLLPDVVYCPSWLPGKNTSPETMESR